MRALHLNEWTLFSFSLGNYLIRSNHFIMQKVIRGGVLVHNLGNSTPRRNEVLLSFRCTLINFLQARRYKHITKLAGDFHALLTSFTHLPLSAVANLVFLHIYPKELDFARVSGLIRKCL